MGVPQLGSWPAAEPKHFYSCCIPYPQWQKKARAFCQVTVQAFNSTRDYGKGIFSYPLFASPCLVHRPTGFARRTHGSFIPWTRSSTGPLVRPTAQSSHCRKARSCLELGWLRAVGSFANWCIDPLYALRTTFAPCHH